MARRINTNVYRFGKNLEWDVYYPAVYFNKGMRFQIMFTLLVDRLMFLSGLRPIKVIVSLEANKMKFLIIAILVFKKVTFVRRLADFTAGNFNVTQFQEPRGFTKAATIRKFDTFYDSVLKDNISMAKLYSSPLSVLDGYLDGMSAIAINSYEKIAELREFGGVDYGLKNFLSKAFLFYYLEKKSKKGALFDSNEIIFLLLSLFENNEARPNQKKINFLVKRLKSAQWKIALLKSFSKPALLKNKNFLFTKKLLILAHRLLYALKIFGSAAPKLGVKLGVLGGLALKNNNLIKTKTDLSRLFIKWLGAKPNITEIMLIIKKKKLFNQTERVLKKNNVLARILLKVKKRRLYAMFEKKVVHDFRAGVLLALEKKIRESFDCQGNLTKKKKLLFKRLGWSPRANNNYLYVSKQKKVYRNFLKKMISVSKAFNVVRQPVMLNNENFRYFKPSGDALAPRAWLANKFFKLEMQSDLSLIFQHNVELDLFLQNSIFLLEGPARFLKNFKNFFSQVFIKSKDAPLFRYAFLTYYLSAYFKAPQAAANIIAEILQFTEFHYGFLGPFRKLIGLLNLKELGFIGMRIGLFGRLNGRDRKFKYYINFGERPALRTLALKVFYGRAQSIPRYGVVHVHVWYYHY